MSPKNGRCTDRPTNQVSNRLIERGSRVHAVVPLPPLYLRLDKAIGGKPLEFPRGGSGGRVHATGELAEVIPIARSIDELRKQPLPDG
jgi:hypothetical protein